MRGPVELAPRVHGLGTDIVDLPVVHEDGQPTLVDAGPPDHTGGHRAPPFDGPDDVRRERPAALVAQTRAFPT